MASLQQKRKKWGVAWRDLSGVQRWRGCPDKRTAEQLLREIEQQIALGRDWKPEEPRKIPGLREIAADWIRACQRRDLASGTLLHYGQYIEDFTTWFEKNHGKQADKLSRLVVEAYYDQLRSPSRAAGKPVALTTALKYMSAVQLFWEWAARRAEHREFVAAYDPPELPARPPTQAIQAPTWAEMDALLEVADGMYRALVVLLRCTGLRIQQAMFLRWEHIDLDRGELRIPAALGKSRREKAGRVVPLAPVLLRELRRPALASWGEPGGYLVPCSTEHRIARSPKMEKIWETVTAPQRAAIYLGHPYHAFRKGFMSGLLELGAKDTAVEYLVGHVMPGVQASYVDPRSLQLKEAIRLVPPIKIG